MKCMSPQGTSALPRVKALAEIHGSLGVATSAAVFVACRSPTSPLSKHTVKERIPRRVDSVSPSCLLHIHRARAPSSASEAAVQSVRGRPPGLRHSDFAGGPGTCLGPSTGVWRAPLEPGVKSRTHSPEGHIPVFSTWSVLLGCLSVQVGIHQATGSEPRAGDLRPRLLCLRTGTSSLHSYPTGVHPGDQAPSGAPGGGGPSCSFPETLCTIPALQQRWEPGGGQWMARTEAKEATATVPRV